MYLGVCRLTFRLPENASLKGKRQVAHSLISRLRQRFNLSVAEVDGQEAWQRLVVGLSCVSNEAHHASEMIDAAIRYAHGLRLDAELVDVQRETMNGV